MTDGIFGTGAFQVAQAEIPGTATPSLGPADSTRADRFQAVFDRTATETPPVDATEQASAADRQRALDTLRLEGEAAVPRTGDTILGGLERLRGVFDAQEARIREVAAGQETGATESLIVAQFEIVQYSMLIDVTSKLTGKATQSFDQLMKGQ